MRRGLRGVALAGLMLASACAPTHAVVVGNRDVATDILLKGAPAASLPPPKRRLSQPCSTKKRAF